MSDLPPDALAFFAKTGLPGRPRGFDGFGDNPQMQDELLDLVLIGRKQATCTLARWFENDPAGLPKPGDLWVIHDGSKTPRAVVRTTSVEVKPIREADAQFAWDEGEGDRSFEYWLREHRAFWQREADQNGFTYSDDLEAVFERFELVWPQRREPGSMTRETTDANGYAARVARQIPGLRDLHRMVTVLLAEQLPANGHVLVLGAGGGLELNAMAELQPEWQFDGVDPSADMLAQARELTAPFADRITLHEGYIEDAPVGPYDGAVCLLTLHFLPQAERLRTLREIAHRLRPAAPLVTAHHSFPLADGAQDRWLGRYAAYSGTQGPLTAMKDRLPVLPPETDEALLRQAGFTDIELFWAALTFKGWVSRRR